ncbi:hypothetical protein [Synechococcus sp. CC9616]|uniref:hypothetical protein n=1 Tax=Synechococcus sp. CC9616 TaxID=110663 RepID=UPI0004903376|nr:hypothetical protein [Synechococcus sp. CC9616]
MKLLPLIGALLLSAAPVQAFQTSEEGKRKLVSYVCDYSYEGKTAEEIIADFNEDWHVASVSYTETTFDKSNGDYYEYDFEANLENSFTHVKSVKFESELLTFDTSLVNNTFKLIISTYKIVDNSLIAKSSYEFNMNTLTEVYTPLFSKSGEELESTTHECILMPTPENFQVNWKD